MDCPRSHPVPAIRYRECHAPERHGRNRKVRLHPEWWSHLLYVYVFYFHLIIHPFTYFPFQTSTALSRRSSFTYELILYDLLHINSYFDRCLRIMSKHRTILLSSLALCRLLNANWISGRQTAQSTYRALSRTRLTQYHATRSTTPLLVRSRTLPVSPPTFQESVFHSANSYFPLF